MDTKNIKDEQIRKQIITASEVYRDKLAGRVFLYVYGESYFEVVFPTDRFRHLTGVNSSIVRHLFFDTLIPGFDSSIIQNLSRPIIPPCVHRDCRASRVAFVATNCNDDQFIASPCFGVPFRITACFLIDFQLCAAAKWAR